MATSCYLVSVFSVSFLLLMVFLVHISFVCLWMSKRQEKGFSNKKTLAFQKANGPKSITKSGLHAFLYSIIWCGSNFVGKMPFHFVRCLLYKNIFKMKIGDRSSIYHGCEIINPWGVSVGVGSVIGIENKIDGRGRVFIGDNVNLSHQVNIWTMQHDPNSEFFAPVIGSVQIGDYVWIGNRVTILPGVKLGRGAVVASGAVVTKNVEEYAIYGGVPAKKIGIRNSDLNYKIKIMPIL
jgi:acetyltransferase-like isoleucine patch superfamily enzyme